MALQNFSILFKQYLADWTIVRVGHLTLKGKKELPCAFPNGALQPLVGDKIYAAVEA